MWGVEATRLLVDLKRSDFLPSYNQEGVRKVVDEINALHHEVEDTVRAEGFDKTDARMTAALVVHHTGMLRNKRCLMAYMKHRLDKIQKLRWETGSVVPAHLKHIFSAAELEYFNEYDQVLRSYMRETGVSLASDMTPPKELHIEVRVKQDCGEIFTDTGTVSLKKNTTHYLRRSDVEHLIKQDYLEQISTD